METIQMAITDYKSLVLCKTKTSVKQRCSPYCHPKASSIQLHNQKEIKKSIEFCPKLYHVKQLSIHSNTSTI